MNVHKKRWVRIGISGINVKNENMFTGNYCK